MHTRTSSKSQATVCIYVLYVFIKERNYHRSRPTNLCQNPTSPRTWTSPGCRSSSSPSPSAAAPAEPAAPSAASAGGPSAAPPAHPAPAVSAPQESPAQRHADGHTARNRPTLMWSWARLSRLSVVFLTESGDRGTCFFSCSRHCLSWARLRRKDDFYRMHESFYLSNKPRRANSSAVEGKWILTCFSPARCEQPCRWKKRRCLCIRPGNHTLLSVSNCGML